MSNTCRLCRKSCNDSLRLHDLKGNPNEIFNITNKYFHEKYLKVDRRSSNPIAALCMACWRHLSVFNTFQETVLMLLDKLIKEEDTPASPISESTVSKEFLAMSCIKVEERTITVPQVPGNKQIEGQTTVTDCSLQIATKVENIEKSNDFQIKENIESREHDDAYLMEEDDHFAVQEYEEENSKQDSGGTLSKLRESPELSAPNTSAFVRKSANEINTIIAKWRPQLDCHVCSEKFPDFLSVKKHFLEEHPSDDFYIKCCNRKIKHRYRLEEHASLHLDPKSVECKECGVLFRTEENLNHHMFFLHSPEGKKAIYKCDFCPKIFTYPTSVYQHMRKHHPNESKKAKKRGRSRKDTGT